ncbi:MAG: DUF2171 domain-containing protein [Kovacikia sp.]
MDVSRIKKRLMVQARNPGCSQGPCVIMIGVVEHVENDQYIKLTEDDSPDGLQHWFPIDWVERVDEEIVYLNRSADKAMSELMNELPA